jgi:hypothetical protein
MRWFRYIRLSLDTKYTHGVASRAIIGGLQSARVLWNLIASIFAPFRRFRSFQLKGELAV